jgi:hypothetical protein
MYWNRFTVKRCTEGLKIPKSQLVPSICLMSLLWWVVLLICPIPSSQGSPKAVFLIRQRVHLERQRQVKAAKAAASGRKLWVELIWLLAIKGMRKRRLRLAAVT